MGQELSAHPCCANRDYDPSGTTPRYPGPTSIRSNNWGKLRSPRTDAVISPRSAPVTSPRRRKKLNSIGAREQSEHWLAELEPLADLDLVGDENAVYPSQVTPTTRVPSDDSGSEKHHPQDSAVLGDITNCDIVPCLSADGPHPSIGSKGHSEGNCKRCCFFPKGRCTSGYNCEFCHYEHGKRIRKRKSRSSAGIPSELEDSGDDDPLILNVNDMQEQSASAGSPENITSMPDTPDTVFDAVADPNVSTQQAQDSLSPAPARAGIAYGFIQRPVQPVFVQPIHQMRPQAQVGTRAVDAPYPCYGQGFANADHGMQALQSVDVQAQCGQDQYYQQWDTQFDQTAQEYSQFGVQHYDSFSQSYECDQSGWQHQQQPQQQLVWNDPQSAALAAASAAAEAAAAANIARQQHMQHQLQQQQLLQQTHMQQQQQMLYQAQPQQMQLMPQQQAHQQMQQQQMQQLPQNKPRQQQKQIGKPKVSQPGRINPPAIERFYEAGMVAVQSR